MKTPLWHSNKKRASSFCLYIKLQSLILTIDLNLPSQIELRKRSMLAIILSLVFIMGTFLVIYLLLD